MSTPDDSTGFDSLYKTFDLLGDLAKESTRGAILVGCSFLEDALGDLLKTHLTSLGFSKGKIKDLTGYGGSMGSLGNRIDMCHIIGLIPSSMAQALHLIRGVRNDFAHRAYERKDIPPATTATLRNLCTPEMQQRIDTYCELVENSSVDPSAEAFQWFPRHTPYSHSDVTFRILIAANYYTLSQLILDASTS